MGPLLTAIGLVTVAFALIIINSVVVLVAGLALMILGVIRWLVEFDRRNERDAEDGL
jgi:hypothetical protein